MSLIPAPERLLLEMQGQNPGWSNSGGGSWGMRVPKGTRRQSWRGGPGLPGTAPPELPEGPGTRLRPQGLLCLARVKAAEQADKLGPKPQQASVLKKGLRGGTNWEIGTDVYTPLCIK